VTLNSFSGAGGLRICWQKWVPDAETRAVVVIAHGASEHGGRYASVARRLVADGYAAYAIDHRGHGDSDGTRSLIDRIDNAVADLDALVDIAAQEYPRVPVFLLGHSMGGTIALRYAAVHQDRLAGLILSGALAALDPVPTAQRIVARTLSAVAPKTPLVEINPWLVSRDEAVVQDYIRDPLVHHGKLPARTVTEMADAIEAFPDALPSITVPTLIMYGSEDKLCLPRGSMMVAERLGSSDVTITAYDGLHHEIFNEPERDQVLDDTCAWLGAHVSAPVA
jgi:acylglycerol lipase